LKYESKPVRGKTAIAVLLGLLVVLMLIAITTPNLLRSRIASNDVARYAAMRTESGPMAESSIAGATVDLRRVVQTGTMRLMVGDPAQIVDEVAAIGRRRGGFVEHSQLYRGDGQSSSAEITLRIPADMFDNVRAEIRQLGKKVDHEDTRASDVTAQSVDLTAALRNYRSEEAQYLGIMARSGTVKDTLEVAQRLSDVRGRIERTQGQLNVLSRQVEMASLAVALRAETAPAPSWSPLASWRGAWRDALAGFADYIDAMLIVLLRIPLVLAWGLTVCALAAAGWHILRWVWKHWFVQYQVTSN
jgi:hypothetical protein